jgi:murein tripeptide amidase MpaA
MNAKKGFLLLAGCLYLAMLSGLWPQTSPAATDQRPLVVRVRAATTADAERLVASGLDLLEMREGDDLFALVTPAQEQQLRDAGWQVEQDARQTALVRRAALAQFDPLYRTVEQTEQLLRDLAAQYPALATLVDYGDSWDKQQPDGRTGYDLLALRITNSAIAGPKPIFFLVAAVHARELSTSELATRFAQELLAGYGSDADITWLLNEHEIVVVPIANPDGRKLAEQGLYQRKNLNDSALGSCSPTSINYQEGVDLNRNFSYGWGTIDRPTQSNCNPTYPGTAPASEPETASLQQFITELFGVRARPGMGEKAAADTPGVLISIHSYSNLVLWPWGNTDVAAPNGPELARLGERFASFNGYAAQQSIRLYPTSGTTDDWSYGELGIASFTFEVGPASGNCGGFMPAYGCLDGGAGGNFWGRNRPALFYAGRVARAPYSQPGGPEATISAMVQAGTSVTVTVELNGHDQPLLGGEISLNASVFQGGTSIPLQAVDGAFDEVDELAFAIIETNGDPNSYLLARGQGANETWGAIDAAWLRPVTAAEERRVYIPIVAENRE